MIVLVDLNGAVLGGHYCMCFPIYRSVFPSFFLTTSAIHALNMFVFYQRQKCFETAGHNYVNPHFWQWPNLVSKITSNGYLHSNLRFVIFIDSNGDYSMEPSPFPMLVTYKGTQGDSEVVIYNISNPNDIGPFQGKLCTRHSVAC